MAIASRLLVLTLLAVVASCGGGSGSSGSGGGNCNSPATILPDESISGSLSNSDCSVARLFPDEAGDNSLLDQYSITLPTDGELTVTMQSTDFDAFLVLFDSDLSIPPIAEDDDSGGLLNASLIVNLLEGTYIILANSATLNPVTGSYTLTTSFQPTVWSPVSGFNAPAARTHHTAVWSGDQMIVWGGNNGNAVANNSGGRYDPINDSWTPVSQSGAPSPRYDHTAVWTGEEMIVWGGYTGAFTFGTLGDGAKYDPLSDTWSPISSTNQPSPRTDHTAVWTGTEMLVWGGASCTGCANAELGTGGRYNPVTDTWTAISAVNAPEARFNHSAVWTGSKMIVWGGASDQGIGSLTLLDNGGVYDPVSDTWVAITNTDAPPPTRCHAAVWTSTGMIVFGGQTGTGLACGESSTNTGARYNPDSDTWSAIADAPVGSSLSGPAAVWTGNRLITWFDNAGGRYDPVTNVWQGISGDNAPSARRHHTLVWTDSRMIVWGGEFAGPLGTGARYHSDFDTTP